MDALVVYESMFGNTKDIAESIAGGMGMRLDTEIVEVGRAPLHLDEGVTLVVLGGPTHAFSMSRAKTRSAAADETTAPVLSREIGLREWLDLVAVQPGVELATFDTSLKKWRRMGTASRAATKRLKRMGLAVAAPPETFYVEGMTGPLAEGELARAYEWGAHLAIRHALNRKDLLLHTTSDQAPSSAGRK